MSLPVFYRRNKLKIATWVYWILLVYIIAALVWWFVELLEQSREMYLFKKELLSLEDPNYQPKLQFIEEERKRDIAQYLGEGLTFLALTLLGAVFVYRAVRRQIRLNEQQQNFMMAVTHELKTPIAVARLNLETMQKRKLEPAQQEKLVEVTLQETGRLSDLCENILLATQMEAGRRLLHPEEINLTELVKDSAAKLRNRFPRKEIRELVEKEVHYRGDRLLLQLLFNNLIENAIKYSPADKPVVVKLEKRADRALFQVEDLGSGIPAAERQKIFEKFYRTGNENTRQTKGTGLGLYLSQKIAEDHATRITVRDNQPSGSIFAVEFKQHGG